MTNQEFFASLPLDVNQDPISMGLLGKYNLAAPMSFWDANPELRNAITGGCGPGGLGDMLVPDNILFLKITLACMIHDWCFAVWNTKYGFELSNNIFKNNMLRIIEQHGSWNRVLYCERKRIAIKYYKAVHYFGEPSFFDSHLRFI